MAEYSYSKSFALLTKDMRKVNLSSDEVKELHNQYYTSKSNVLKDKLTTYHLRYVITLANGFKTSKAVTLDDLIGYGSIGLVRALEAFDPTTGYSFTTFAKPAIVREIINQLQYEDIIRPKSNDKKKLKAGEISKYNFCSTDELIIGIENTTIGESISGDCYDSLFEFDEQNSFQKEDEFWDYLKEVIKLPVHFDLARAKYSLAIANGKRIKVSEQDIADMNGYTKQNVSGKLQILLKQLRKDPKLRKWWEQNKMNY